MAFWALSVPEVLSCMRAEHRKGFPRKPQPKVGNIYYYTRNAISASCFLRSDAGLVDRNRRFSVSSIPNYPVTHKSVKHFRKLADATVEWRQQWLHLSTRRLSDALQRRARVSQSKFAKKMDRTHRKRRCGGHPGPGFNPVRLFLLGVCEGHCLCVSTLR